MRLLIHDYAGHPFQVQLSRDLARRGHAVTHAFAGGLLTPRGSLHRKPDDPDGFQIVEIPMDPNYRRDKYRFMRRRRMEVAYGRSAADFVDREHPEAVISSNTPTESQLAIATTCSGLGIRFIPWIQDFYSVAVGKLTKKKLPVIGNLIGWWYRHLERKTLRQADVVISITEDFVPILRRFGVPPDRIVVIPNWAPLDELPLKPRRNPWSGAKGLDDKFAFLYSGTLAMKHNPDILRRLAVAFKDDPAVRVVVISEGPGADYLQERVRVERLENLQILPFQSFSEMPDLMATADVLLAILEADAGAFSVPSKVLTYHCAGRPILAAMPPGNLAARIISQTGSGLCVGSENIPAFLNAAVRLRSKPALREEKGRNARCYAQENFDITLIGDRFEECLLRGNGNGAREVMGNGHAAPGVVSPAFTLLQFVALVVGLLGVVVAIYLSLRSSPQMRSVPWMPYWLARWCDFHGKTRNFPAFLMLGVPLLIAIREGRAQLCALVAVGLVAMLLEIAQIFIPTRTASAIDVLCSWAGLLVAWAMVEGVFFCLKRTGSTASRPEPII